MAQFSPGDFVPYADVRAQTKSKLKTQWIGPAQVEKVISQRIFEVRHRLLGATKEVHASHLEFYADKELQVAGDILDMVTHNSEGHVVHRLVLPRYDKPAQRYEVLVE